MRSLWVYVYNICEYGYAQMEEGEGFLKCWSTPPSTLFEVESLLGCLLLYIRLVGLELSGGCHVSVSHLSFEVLG